MEWVGDRGCGGEMKGEVKQRESEAGGDETISLVKVEKQWRRGP